MAMFTESTLYRNNLWQNEARATSNLLFYFIFILLAVIQSNIYFTYDILEILGMTKPIATFVAMDVGASGDIWSVTHLYLKRNKQLYNYIKENLEGRPLKQKGLAQLVFHRKISPFWRFLKICSWFLSSHPACCIPPTFYTTMENTTLVNWCAHTWF